ncbi:MAG: metal-dependent transcriptional regulator [Bacteroidetes bacterium]|nr:MAG: metal-dependent transcriptional regulator [Bacteroidota bacterium]
MLNFSTSEENYIKTIFHLQNGQNTVTTNALAEKLSTRPASVTDMMKKLKAKKLLHYQPYQGFRLSNEGKKVALDIIRRHRLWEYFLAEKLKFKWDEVHVVAEDQLIDKLDEYLGYPKSDPHGDPIPDSLGKMENSEQINLAELAVNKPAEVCRVVNQSDEMLELLQHKKITIGARVEIKRKFEFDHSIEIRLRQSKRNSSDQPSFSISEQLAKNIFVSL